MARKAFSIPSKPSQILRDGLGTARGFCGRRVEAATETLRRLDEVASDPLNAETYTSANLVPDAGRQIRPWRATTGRAARQPRPQGGRCASLGVGLDGDLAGAASDADGAVFAASVSTAEVFCFEPIALAESTANTRYESSTMSSTQGNQPDDVEEAQGSPACRAHRLSSNLTVAKRDWQIIGQRPGRSSNWARAFRGTVTRSTLPPDGKRMLHVVNLRGAWFFRKELRMWGTGETIPPEVRKLACSIMRHVMSRHRRPDLSRISMRLDHRASQPRRTDQGHTGQQGWLVGQPVHDGARQENRRPAVDL